MTPDEMPERKPWNGFLRISLIILIYCVSASILMYVFVTRGGLNSDNFKDDSNLSFSRMIQWTAPWPYIYRTLLPSTVSLISRCVPEGVKETTNRLANNKPFLRGIGWDTKYSFEVFLALGLIFCVWIAEAFLWRHLIGVYYQGPRFVRDLAPSAGLLALATFFITNWTTIYDPVTPFMVTLGLVLITDGRRRLFYLYFPLAVLNKLTSAMLTCVFVIAEFNRMRLRMLGAHVCVQAAIWCVIVFGLLHLFRSNPGNRVDFQLWWNMYGFLSAVSWYHAVYTFGFLAIWVFLIAYGWKRRPIMLRKMFVAAALIFVPFVILFGKAADEMRVWYDLYPFAFLFAVGSISDIFQIHLDGRAAENGEAKSAAAPSPERQGA